MKTTAILSTAAAFAAILIAAPAVAQVSDSPAVTDTVVSAPIERETSTDAQTLQNAIEAMRNATEAANAMTVLVNANSIDIVEVPAPSEAQMEELPAQTEAAISELRDAIAMNAIVTYALDSEQINVGDVLAAEISDEKDVIVYVRASE